LKITNLEAEISDASVLLSGDGLTPSGFSGRLAGGLEGITHRHANILV